MTFLSPSRLLLLVGVAALAAAYLAVQARRDRYAVRFTNLALLDVVAPERPRWRRHLPAVAFLLAVTALVAAFARPARDERVPRERATVMMAIDTSLSMQAEDITPDRIRAAKAAAADFVDLLPDSINLGLVSFDGVARVEVPPTTEHVLVQTAIADLELHESTAIGEAIYACLDAIDTMPPAPDGAPVPGRIVLMSDGETTVGRPNEEAAQAAADAEVPVSTIAFGTDAGMVTVDGTAITVPVDEDALANIAEVTGGTSFTAASADQLEEVYADIGSSLGYETEQREITGWFLGAGLVLLLLAAAGSLVWSSRLP
ncbi:MAG TPA: VWA domain-containing protein [Acidimicrobiales bacterium]|jgi:Ca-activated chloride channel family protein